MPKKSGAAGGGGKKKAAPRGKIPIEELNSDTNHNKHITDDLDLIREDYKQQRDFFKMRSYEKAIANISRYTKAIENKKEAMRLPGVGKGIAEKIEEILEKGGSEHAEKMKADPTLLAKEDLERILNVGPKKAQQLMDAGYRSLGDVRVALANGTLGDSILDEKARFWAAHLECIEPVVEQREVEEVSRVLEGCLGSGMVLVPIGTIGRGHIPTNILEYLITTPSFDPSFEEYMKMSRSVRAAKEMQHLPDILEALGTKGAFTHTLTINATRASFLLSLPFSSITSVFGSSALPIAKRALARFKQGEQWSEDVEDSSEDVAVDVDTDADADASSSSSSSSASASSSSSPSLSSDVVVLDDDDDDEGEGESKEPTAKKAKVAPMAVAIPNLEDLDDDEEGGVGAGAWKGSISKVREQTSAAATSATAPSSTSTSTSAPSSSASSSTSLPAPTLPPASSTSASSSSSSSSSSVTDTMRDANGGELRYVRLVLVPWRFRAAAITVGLMDDGGPLLSSLRSAAKKKDQQLSACGIRSVLPVEDESSDGEGDVTVGKKRKKPSKTPKFSEPSAITAPQDLFTALGRSTMPPLHTWGDPKVRGPKHDPKREAAEEKARSNAAASALTPTIPKQRARTTAALVLEEDDDD